MGYAVTCALYRLDRMLQAVTCLDARGLTPDRSIAEAPRSSMAELAAWTVEADRVLTF